MVIYGKFRVVVFYGLREMHYLIKQDKKNLISSNFLTLKFFDSIIIIGVQLSLFF